MVVSPRNEFNSDKARATRSLFFSASEAVLAQAEKLANDGNTVEALALVDVFVNGRADPDNIVASHSHLAANDAHRASKLVDRAVEISKKVQATVLQNARNVLADPERMLQLITQPDTARGIAVDTARTDGLIALADDDFDRAILFRGVDVLNEYLATPITEANVTEGLDQFKRTVAILRRTSDTIGALYVLNAVDLVDTRLSNSTRQPRTHDESMAAWGRIQEGEIADAQAERARGGEPFGLPSREAA